MSKRIAHFRVPAYESPIQPVEDTGWSDLAIHSGSAWDGKNRPEGWIGKEFVLVVHTTGSQLPDMAAKEGVYPTVRAQKHYGRTHGCHYVLGYRGIAGGDLIQMAWEGEQANGVGMTDQRKSVQQGRFKADLTPATWKAWTKRWPGYRSPMDLLPGTRTANSVAIHVEMPPVTKKWGEFRSHCAGKLWFTEEQHLSVAALACDIAYRKGWEGRWWRTPHLVGHSDLSPMTRQNSRGGWDPGAMYSPMRFSWEAVIREICNIEGVPFTDEDLSKEPRSS
jgi:hypothetical protein